MLNPPNFNELIEEFTLEFTFGEVMKNTKMLKTVEVKVLAI